MKLVFVTVSAPAVKLLPQAAKALKGAVEVTVWDSVREFSPQEGELLRQQIRDCDGVFLDLMGAPPGNVDYVNQGCAETDGQVIPFGASPREHMRLGSFGYMGGGGRKAPSPGAMQKMSGMARLMGRVIPGKMRDMRNYALLCSYFQNASLPNFTNLLILLAAEYAGVTGLPKLQEPVEAPPAGIYDPGTGKVCRDAAKFGKAMGFSRDRPRVVLHFTASAYPTDTLPVVREMARRLGEFADVIPIGTNGFFPGYRKELTRFLEDGRPDLYLDCVPFRLGAGPMGGDAQAGIELLQKMDCAYLHPMFLTRRSEQEWRDTESGCSPNEVLISFMLPEMDGTAESLPVASMEQGELRIIPERMERLLGRVKAHLRLRKLPNREKRIAILCYNYPPGEGNLFGGAFLDTFASVSAILKRLNREGYEVPDLTEEELKSVFTAGKAVNSGKYDCNWEDRILYETEISDPEIDGYWGPPRIMTEEGKYFLPGIRRGNLFLGLQPSRSGGGDEISACHDRSIPPHHQYAAFYRWLREEFRADAVIHVGTHGTLEFLPGKEAGLSGDCWPDRLLGDIPNLYLYYCGNPSEAVIARRRSYANLISYQPPVFVEGGLYGEWAELSTMLEDWRHLTAVSPESAREALEGLLDRAETLGLPRDAEDIEEELYRMASSRIPRGLHVFGTPYTEEEVAEYAEGIAQLRAGDGEITPEIRLAAQADARNSVENHEMEGLLTALRDGYNVPKLGGDIFRSPEVLPTGYNLYQFDARAVPSEAAMVRGRKIAENTLEAYRKEHGAWPKTVAVIAWGLEASRTQGETIGQILGYLGVRRAKNSSPWEHQYELIPAAELGRPRIDVVVNICGFFRDLFPNAIDNLDDVFRMVWQEGDGENYLKEHADARFAATGDAEQAPGRLFGPREGEYGTNLRDLVERSGWKAEEELGQSFTDSLHYLYTRHSRGLDARDLYRDCLATVDCISQLRASTEYEVTDLDHYYEFFGGLAKSVELVRGERSSLYITDVTAGQLHTETADKSIARGLRTRVLNPKWIDGMLAHPFHGGQKIAQRFENVLGLAATTGAVDPRFYDDLHSTYVSDENRRHQMLRNNPHAYLAILGRLLELSQRGYWKAEEGRLEEIRQAVLEAEGEIEDQV